MKAFEAAARHLSFSEAANELNVTPAAVSHQVKALEAQLGVNLFHRLTRGVQLTDAGRSALPLLSEGFDKLAEGIENVSRFRESDVLSISVSPSFGAIWLVPKLNNFRRQHPDIEVRIDGTDRLVDVGNGEADVAIRYGAGAYKGVQVERLFGLSNAPVCSPGLLQGENALLQPEDLSRHTLLHIDWQDAEAGWRMWLLAAGLSHIDATRGPIFTQESMALQAAIDGHGVALLGDRLVADHLAAGTLVYPFGPSLNKPLQFAYYLLTEIGDEKKSKVAAFRSWLLETIRPA